jgi:hypothetical protein
MDVCPTPNYGDTSTGYGICVTICPSLPSLYAYIPTRLCVSLCPSTGNYFAYDGNRTCVTSCPAGTFAYTPTRKCLSSCPVGYYSDNFTSNYVCQASYTSCTQGFGDDYLHSCVLICTGATPVNTFGYSQRCLSFCPGNTYADSYTGTRLCVNTCPGVGTNAPNLYGDPTTHTCTNKCITPNTWADYITRLCLATCTTPTYS